MKKLFLVAARALSVCIDCVSTRNTRESPSLIQRDTHRSYCHFATIKPHTDIYTRALLTLSPSPSLTWHMKAMPPRNNTDGGWHSTKRTERRTPSYFVRLRAFSLCAHLSPPLSTTACRGYDQDRIADGSGDRHDVHMYIHIHTYYTGRTVRFRQATSRHTLLHGIFVKLYREAEATNTTPPPLSLSLSLSSIALSIRLSFLSGFMHKLGKKNSG